MKKNICAAFILSCLLCMGIFVQTALCADEAINSADYLKENLMYEQAAQDRATEGRLRLPNVGEVAFKMVFFLLIILLFFFGLALVFQKLYRSKVPEAQSGNDVIKILHYRKFDAKRGVYLIDVLGKVLVIGSDIDGLNLITEITDKGSVEKAHQMADVKLDLFTFNPFANMLEGFSKQYPNENARERRKDRESRGLLKKINDLKSRLDT